MVTQPNHLLYTEQYILCIVLMNMYFFFFFRLCLSLNFMFTLEYDYGKMAFCFFVFFFYFLFFSRGEFLVKQKYFFKSLLKTKEFPVKMYEISGYPSIFLIACIFLLSLMRLKVKKFRWQFMNSPKSFEKSRVD